MDDLSRTAFSYGSGDTFCSKQFVIVILLFVRQIIVASSTPS